jgi:hypothetical protein
MDLFDGNIPDISKLIEKPAIRLLFDSLSNKLICATSGQIHSQLNAEHHIGRGQEGHERVRNLLRKLENAGYIRSESVELVPPYISKGVVFGVCSSQFQTAMPRVGSERVHVSGLTLPEACEYVKIAKERVPAPKAFLERRLYFVSEGSWANLDNIPRSCPPSWRAIRLINEHRQIASLTSPSPVDLVSTRLSVTLSLNQLALDGAFGQNVAVCEVRSADLCPVCVDAEIWLQEETSVDTRQGGGGWPDVDSRVEVFFLRPCLPENLQKWCSSWELTGNRAWWV